jgi:putative component of membrane protein insertase Oxa1/YidC/SpoIIIJ protein YidD
MVTISVYSQDFGPWEAEDSQPHQFEQRTIQPANTALRLIRFYQERIAPKSIRRCPFHISCSAFAYTAIKKHGLFLGICYFIDRNLYRENPGITRHYRTIISEEGTYKLDDDFYLNN